MGVVWKYLISACILYEEYARRKQMKLMSLNISLSKLAEVVMFVICIWEVSVSNLDYDTNCLD